ncbi:hypothetical protein RZ70_06890 [Apilactobacillus kunkeei]|uniref:hypothetical protein n=1 Tax=Apilactobacillus kunkeei TaxID=148814 RepID=UPI0006C36F02|nr:hypothetical protein [Apilactobacillus kunkeei]KOY72824.1 hypothetical protein RZ70_06890 [Apilactobacillus kunkeei]
MDILIGICQSLLANLLTPIVLFIIAYWLRNSDFVVKFVAKVYNEVNNNYLILKELDEASGTDDVVDTDDLDRKEEKHNNFSSDDVLSKLSKDYGREGDWTVRTFYTINRKQLDEFKYIQFSIREMTTKITLSTEDLINKFLNKSDEDDVVDAADKIRVFLFQNTDSKDFYLVRFGKRPFRKPFLLQEDEIGVYRIK